VCDESGSVSEDTAKHWKEFLHDLCRVMNLEVFLMLKKQVCFAMYFIAKWPLIIFL
jgi:hypothetical protein